MGKIWNCIFLCFWIIKLPNIQLLWFFVAFSLLCIVWDRLLSLFIVLDRSSTFFADKSTEYFELIFQLYRHSKVDKAIIENDFHISWSFHLAEKWFRFFMVVFFSFKRKIKQKSYFQLFIKVFSAVDTTKTYMFGDELSNKSAWNNL